MPETKLDPASINPETVGDPEALESLANELEPQGADFKKLLSVYREFQQYRDLEWTTDNCLELQQIMAAFEAERPEAVRLLDLALVYEVPGLCDEEDEDGDLYLLPRDSTGGYWSHLRERVGQ